MLLPATKLHYFTSLQFLEFKKLPEKVDLVWAALFSHPLSGGFSVESVQGMLYNPVSGAWSWTNSTAINYALHAVKLTEDPHPEDPAHTAATHSWATSPENKSENGGKKNQMCRVPNFPEASCDAAYETDVIQGKTHRHVLQWFAGLMFTSLFFNIFNWIRLLFSYFSWISLFY